MAIVKGKILSQPQLREAELVFQLQSGEETFPVIRQKREDQKLDILFLCTGQEVVLWGDTREACLVADKIRITDYSRRQYGPDEDGEIDYGNSTVNGTDLGDPDV